MSLSGLSLVSPENALAMDGEAAVAWGLNPFALVEAAGRSCAAVFSKEVSCAGKGEKPPVRRHVLACAGPGNNGADALVMLRALLTEELLPGLSAVSVLLCRDSQPDERTPRSEAVKALRAMGVPVFVWGEGVSHLIQDADIVIDGIAGTGIRGALKGVPLEMVTALNERRKSCTVVSVDVPSGAGTGWKPGFPLLLSDYTLAVEPRKTVLYTPAIRPRCGTILPVTGIFPPALAARYRDGGLLSWEEAAAALPPLSSQDHKYCRGLVEIRAGSPGFAGAARLAALGASAAGAGLVRLVVDDELYPVLASHAGGIMVSPLSLLSPPGARMHKPDALLLGPGWLPFPLPESRREALEAALKAEQAGTPLVLDAEALKLLDKKTVFHGRAILTPHTGELEALSGFPRELLLSDPQRIASLAGTFNAAILFKSHVMICASPDGSLLFIDGMDPSLGTGGSGDFLAGLCSGIAGRLCAGEHQGGEAFDPAAATAAAGSLLVQASSCAGRRFYDPAELAAPASRLAGEAWLGVKKAPEGPGRNGYGSAYG